MLGHLNFVRQTQSILNDSGLRMPFKGNATAFPTINSRLLSFKILRNRLKVCHSRRLPVYTRKVILNNSLKSSQVQQSLNDLTKKNEPPRFCSNYWKKQKKNTHQRQHKSKKKKKFISYATLIQTPTHSRDLWDNGQQTADYPWPRRLSTFCLETNTLPYTVKKSAKKRL